MIKRPKRGESEDDLLRYQEEFFASQQVPSVVVKKSKSSERDVVTMEDDTEGPVDRQEPSSVKFPNDDLRRFRICDEDMDPRQRLDAKDKEHISEVLTNIKEKDIAPFFNFKTNCYKNGFPSAPLINKDLITEPGTTKTGKKISLFAQQFSNFNQQKDLGKTNYTKNPILDTVPDKSMDYVVTKDIVTDGLADSQLPSTSKEISIEPDVQSCENLNDPLNVNKGEIHQENVKRLLAMSEEEILSEQKKLLQTLDPKIIDYLQSRSKDKSSDNSNAVQQSSSSQVTIDDICENVINDNAKLDENVKDKTEDIEMKQEDTADDEVLVNPHKEFNIKKDYVNMNIVEKEKLAWMKDIPKIELKKGNAVPRFDFEGMLIDPTSEVPFDTGLHHHGDEPGVPGYTLEELFHLARSNFPQQRVFSLQLIGRIFKMYHQQEFAGKLTADLLTKCLDAGLIFMLRWSLDEQTEQIYSAAVSAIANVVYITDDQDLVENYLFAEDGHIIPSLCTYYKKTEDRMSQAEKEEDRDVTDAEMISLDLVKGLLQIQIIPRLRYIIEMCNPSIPAVNNCLCVLIRLAQHNVEVAYEVFKHKLLMSAVFKLLTSSSAECKQETKVYALQLIRCLCQASKSLSQDMVNTYRLDEIICSEFSSKESSLLYSSGSTYIQICHIWNILLRYGVCTSLVRDLYPAIMSQLQQNSTSYKNLGDKMLASLVNIVEVSVTCTASKAIEWSLIEGFYPVIKHNIMIIQKDMFKEEQLTHPYYVSALLRCCATYYKFKNTKLSDVNPVTLLDEVEDYWKQVIQPIILSPLLHKLFDEMREFSDFQTFPNPHGPHFKHPENLPSYGTYCVPEGRPPSLTDGSSLIIVQALLTLIHQLVTINKTLVVKVLPIVIAPETLAYIKFLLESKNFKRCSILISTRLEISLLSHLLELFYMVGNAHGFLKFGQTALNAIQEISFQLICYLQKDDISIAKTLLRKIIFNSKIFKRQNYMLWFSEYYENNVEEKVKEQLQSSRTNLQHIGTMYKEMLFAGDKKNSEKISCLISSMQKKAVPSDWMFYPIINFYNMSVNVEQEGGIITSASPEVISTIRLCLQFVLLVEVTKPALVSNIPETIRLTRLICLFMTEGLLFNEQSIKDLLISVMVNFASPSFQSYLNFEMDIPGITSFVDLYTSVVGMYISSSFNDYGFANILLFPLQLEHDVKYRLLIWTEYSDILRLFPLPLNQVICDIKKFLAAENEDLTMIRLYFQSLIGGTAKPTWCPLFYLIAVHHVNQYIFSDPCDIPEHGQKNLEGQKRPSPEQEKAEKSSMLKTVLGSSNKTMVEDVILYKCFDINGERGMNKFSQLPPSRELLVRSIQENR